MADAINNWVRDKLRADRYDHRIAGILTERFPGVPIRDVGQQGNKIWHAGTKRVMVRVRPEGDTYKRYGRQFTIRASRRYGETEIDRVMRGDVDLYLYAHATKDRQDLEAWYLLDLRVFRAKSGVAYEDQANHDGSSTFRIYDQWRFPKELVIAMHEPAPRGPNLEAIAKREAQRQNLAEQHAERAQFAAAMDVLDAMGDES